MKDLDKNEVYGLRGATSEQLEELLDWLRARQQSWYNTQIWQLVSDRYIRYDGRWVRGSVDTMVPTTHISTLFEDEFVLPEKMEIRGHYSMSTGVHNYGRIKVDSNNTSTWNLIYSTPDFDIIEEVDVKGNKQLYSGKYNEGRI